MRRSWVWDHDCLFSDTDLQGAVRVGVPLAVFFPDGFTAAIGLADEDLLVCYREAAAEVAAPAPA